MVVKTVDLKKAETFAFKTLIIDGLMDFWIGIAFLLIGLGWAFEMYLVASFSALIALPMWHLSRKYLSEPRMGSVNLNETRKAKGSRQLIGSALLGSATLGIVLYFAFSPEELNRDLLQEYIPMLPAIILAVMVGMGTMFFRAPRFLAYAAWMVASAYYGVNQYGTPSAPMLMGSILPIAGGIYHFTKFVRANPKV